MVALELLVVTLELVMDKLKLRVFLSLVFKESVLILLNLVEQLLEVCALLGKEAKH